MSDSQGKKVKRKTKSLRNQTTAPTFLTAAAKGGDRGKINENAYYKSRNLVHPAPGVEEMNIRSKFKAPNGQENNFRLSEMKPEELVRMQKDLETQSKTILAHRISAWSINKNRPEDKARLKDIDPELYDKMYHETTDAATFSMYLDQILKAGMIRNEEDRLFVTSLLDPQIIIPVFPLWDPDGNVLGEKEWSAIMEKIKDESLPEQTFGFGIFSKKLLSSTPVVGFQSLGNTPTQRRIKAMILFHLLPELKENGAKSIDDIARDGVNDNLLNEAQNVLRKFVRLSVPFTDLVGFTQEKNRVVNAINAYQGIGADPFSKNGANATLIA